MSSIQGLGSMQGMMGMGGMRQMQSLTDDQKSQIQSILSEYDPDNITAETAQEIFEKFREAGIRPAKGMKEAIEEAGFDAEELRSLGMSEEQGMPPGGMQGMQGMGMPPPPPAELTEEQEDEIASILSEYDPDEITEETAKEIFEKFREAGIQPSKGMKEAIEEAGFDAEELRSLGMSQFESMGGYSSQGINTSALQSLQSILNGYDLSSITSDQKSALYTQLQTAGLLQSGSVINIGI